MKLFFLTTGKVTMIRIMASLLISFSFSIFAFNTSSFAAGYTLSMLPRYSTEEINIRVVSLAKYLSTKTGLEITPTLTSTFDQYKKQLLNGSIDIGYQNPYVYVLASAAHEVLAMAVKGPDRDKFRGVIITRAGSSLRTLSELKGKDISIVGYTSAGGYLSQKLTLQRNGIDVQKECNLIEAPENKQENVILSVFTGDVNVGFIRESAFHKADISVPANALRILQGTAWLPNWALSVNRSMPAEDKKKIEKAIRELRSNSPVLKIVTYTY
ncbi:MAG TPA: phosphate/phosphite/phosphonate ABC transporter substrate-binding protein [Piscirickettsiaceae bacterium]|nr:phosphate/phosphite/phosphonate ABC transporter substrate-binding protein [Piscirickettsiaceae bacterium]